MNLLYGIGKKPCGPSRNAGFSRPGGRCRIIEMTDGGSFNGRTTDSDSVNRGSNPRLPAKINQGVRRLQPAPFFRLWPNCDRLPEKWYFPADKQPLDSSLSKGVNRHWRWRSWRVPSWVWMYLTFSCTAFSIFTPPIKNARRFLPIHERTAQSSPARESSGIFFIIFFIAHGSKDG